MIEAVITESDKIGEKQESINLPKNIRQIGDISKDKKIYIEDYTQSYIKQTVRNRVIPCMGVLFGNKVRYGSKTYIFINGAVEANKGIMRNDRVIITQSLKQEVLDEATKYYHNTNVTGWYYVSALENIEENMSILKAHIDNFQKKEGIFIHYNYEKDDVQVYANIYGKLTLLPGYYIYFERNKNMQDYMIDKLKPKTTESKEKDVTAYKIREKIKNKNVKKEHERLASATYAVATVLLVFAMTIGMNMMKNSEKINSVDNTINSIATTISEIGKAIIPEKESSTDTSAVEVMKLQGEVETETDTTTATQNEQISSDNESTNTEKVTSQEFVRTHTVKEGETIIAICKMYYGSDDKKTVLLQANNLSEDDKIYVGQELVIP